MSEKGYPGDLPIVEKSLTLNGNFLSYCVKEEEFPACADNRIFSGERHYVKPLVQHFIDFMEKEGFKTAYLFDDSSCFPETAGVELLEPLGVDKESDSGGPYFFGMISPNSGGGGESLEPIFSIVPLRGVSDEALDAFRRYYESFPANLRAD